MSDTPKTRHVLMFPDHWKADDVELVLDGILEQGLVAFNRGERAKVIELTLVQGVLGEEGRFPWSYWLGPADE